MRINLAIPEDKVTAHVLNAALEPITRLNEAMIRAGEVPSFDRALKNGHVRWQPEPPGQESFDHAAIVLGRRWGDCDDIAPYAAGSLRASGADPGARAIVRKSGPKTWHAVVQRSDGMIEDPSKRAGMPTRGERANGAATLPRMSDPPRQAVVGDVGAFIYRPEIAVRPHFDLGYEARVDIPWFAAARGKPSATEIAMATLHSAPLAATAITGAIDSACQLAVVGGYGHPEHVDRLCAIADRLQGMGGRELAHTYGEPHAIAAESYAQSLVGWLPYLAEGGRRAAEKKKSSLRAVAVAVPRSAADSLFIEGGHEVGRGFFDSLARVAIAVGTGGASEAVHAISPQAGRAMDNAVKVAGRAIGHAMDAIVDAEHEVSKLIARIPYVGGPLAMIFDAGFHLATGPMVMTVDIAIKGKRIDRAFMDHVKQQLQDFKNVGPYVQMVVSLVPGWGTAVSAAIGMGLALANGQPIDQVILAGVSSALPGGPLAKAAVSLAYSGIHAAITKEKLNVASLGSMAMGAAADALSLPPMAKNALMAGVKMAGDICNGVKPEVAISHGVIDALPIPKLAKDALQEADSIALDLAHGKRVDKTLLSHVGNVANLLPINDAKLKAQLVNVARTGQSMLEGVKPEIALMSALKNGAADALIELGGKALPADARKALNTGLSIGNGVVHQARKLEQLVSSGTTDKLLKLGTDWAKSHPAVLEARKLASAGAGVRGFDIGAGLLSQQSQLFDLTAVRNKLVDAERKGFDMAAAVRIGLVAHPPATNLPPAAQAGRAIAHGVATQHPANVQAIMQTVAAVPVAAKGALAALERRPCPAMTHDQFRTLCMQIHGPAFAEG